MSRRSNTRSKSLLKLPAWGLVLLVLALGVASFLPAPLVDQLPQEVREVVQVATEIRQSVTASPGTGPTTAGIEPDPANLPKVAGSFSTARKWLYERVYHDRQETFYCGCDYDSNNRIDLSSCGLESLAGNNRAERVEAEHVFPASQFGNFRQCWREPSSFTECQSSSGRMLSGRNCCERVDPIFKAAHNDLHNLYPSVGQVNGQRSNYNWGMVSSRDAETFGTCGIRIDASIRRVQPPDAVRGDIARTMLYMRDTYGFRLSSQDTQLFGAWNNQDPPDAWEIERNRRIKAIQGIGNRYVEDYKRL
jgi:deoxyribonuclease I